MGEDFYMQEGLNVESYDTGGLPEADVGFFMDLAREGGGPVLDLGCGTGRVAWPLADAGFEVVGLDRSEPMLRRAEAKRPDHSGSAPVRFERGSMEKFQLPETFGMAFSAFRAFQSLLRRYRNMFSCWRVLALFKIIADRGFLAYSLSAASITACMRRR